MRRGSVEKFAIVGPQNSQGGLAQPDGLFEDRLEHRSEIARRRIDDLNDLGCCGLSLQRLAKLGGALIELPPKFLNGLLKIGYRVVDRRGHLLVPSGQASSPRITTYGMVPPVEARRLFGWTTISLCPSICQGNDAPCQMVRAADILTFAASRIAT
jgi:hypothetical protein